MEDKLPTASQVLPTTKSDRDAPPGIGGAVIRNKTNTLAPKVKQIYPPSRTPTRRLIDSAEPQIFSTTKENRLPHLVVQSWSGIGRALAYFVKTVRRRPILESVSVIPKDPLIRSINIGGRAKMLADTPAPKIYP